MTRAEPTRRPTLRSVAAAAGVSVATVSLVLRDKAPSIPAETAERVRRLADEQGYRPNRAAQAMKTGRTGIVLVSLQMMSDPWSQNVADVLGERASQQGLVALTQGQGDWFDTILQIQPDVAYIDSPEPGPDTDRRLAHLVKRGQRMVVFSEELHPAGFDVVYSDAAAGTGLVLSEVLSLTDDVAYLLPTRGDGVLPTQRARHRAYLDAVADGRIYSDRTVPYDGSRAMAFETALHLLDGLDRPEAIVANTDYAGLAAISAAQYLGLRVPEDVLVTGLGNTLEAAESAPTLTTAGPDDFFVRQADLVLSAVGREPSEGVRHFFEWQLHPRQSTARLGQPDATFERKTYR